MCLWALSTNLLSIWLQTMILMLKMALKKTANSKRDLALCLALTSKQLYIVFKTFINAQTCLEYHNVR